MEGIGTPSGAPQVPETQEEKIAKITTQLKTYAEQHKLRGLEGRIQRGLDPAAMLAVKETRDKLDKVAAILGADMKDVESVTDQLHVGAIWALADKLAAGTDPNIQTWIVAAEVTTFGKEKETDLSDQEFLKDLKRIDSLLTDAVQDPNGFATRARENLITSSKEQFELDDDVPVSGLDSGFLAMAVNGHKAGIVKDKAGLLFVGANELNYESLGLRAEVKEDRGRQVTFYVDEEGNDVVKKLYPGFAIVLNGDLEVAKKLARSGMRKAESDRLFRGVSGASHIKEE